MTVKAAAKRPCGSCPYRRDVPSGVWAEEEYAILPDYDKPLAEQPPSVFLCHQQDGCLCAGWVGTHDMGESLGLRIAAASETISVEDYYATLDHVPAVPLFASGAEAAAHGLRDVEAPGTPAVRVIGKLLRKLEPEEALDT